MAAPPKKNLAFELASGDKASLKKVAPKKPVVGKKKPKPTLRPEYNLVFDPTGQQSEALQGELDAIRDLYLSSAGRDIEEEPDKRVALEQAGLLKPTVSRKKASELKRGGSDEFASAMDALDAVKGGAKSWLTRGVDAEKVKERAVRGTGDALGALVFGDYEKNPALLQFNPLAQARFVAEQVAPRVRDASLPVPGVPMVVPGVTVGEAFGKAASVIPAIGRTPLPVPGVPLRVPGLTIGKAVGAAGKGAGAVIGKTAEGAAKSFSNIPTGIGALRPAVSGTGQAYTPSVPQLETLGGRSEVFERIAARPNDYIDTTRKKPIRIANANEQTDAVIESAKAGRTPADLNDLIGGSNPFSPMGELSMKGMAAENGWDTADWDELTVGDKAFRAANNNDYGALFWRSVVRGVGEVGAAPAGIKALIGASASALGGDVSEAEAVFEAAVSPYVASNETYKKRGFWVAAQEFIRDQPVDAALLFVTAAKGASTAGGVAARAGAFGPRASTFASRGRAITVKGDFAEQAPIEPDAIPLPSIPESVGPGLARQREWVAASQRAAAARAATDAENRANQRVFEEQQKAFEETGQMVDVTPDVVIGRAGRGIGGTLFKEFVKAPTAKRVKLYRNYLQRKSGERRQRFDVNVAQGEGIELRSTITRLLGEGSSELVKDRAAFNLIMPSADFDGTPVTPGYVAKFYEAELDDHLGDVQARLEVEGGKPDADELQKTARLEAGILRMRQLDEVEIDAETMTRLREGVKPIADVIEEHMARAMNMPIEEARRANYIRLVAMDRMASDGLEARAQRAYAERNEPIGPLVATQKRLKRQAQRILDKASETGWGKYGPKKSRERFTREYNKLLINLELGEKLARQNDNSDLADVFAEAKRDLVGARMRATSGPGARVDVVPEQGVSDVRIPVEPMAGRLWSDQFGDRGPIQSAVSSVPGATVEMVRASELRGMEGNPTRAEKVADLRGQEYENPIIVDYDPRTGFAYVSEGNHRLAAATDDQFIPVQVMTGKVDPKIRRNAKRITDPNVLFDDDNYVPSNLYPHEIGIAVRGSMKPVAPSRRTPLVDAIAGLRLTPDQIERLSPSARLEYEAAQRAADRATGERATEAGALERAGVKRTDVGKVAYAEDRVNQARAALSAHLALPIPDEKTVAKLQAKVDKAEAQRDARSVALLAGQRARKAEKQRDKRIKKAIIASGRQVLDTNEIRVALDVSNRFAVMEIKTARDLLFRIDRARLETLDAFIARQLASDENPLLHLVQSPDMENVGRAMVIETDRAISRAPTAFIRKGRFKASKGDTFINAAESANLWKNLLRDTIEVKTAAVLQERLSDLVAATSIRYRFSPSSLERANRMVVDDPEFASIAAKDGFNAAQRAALNRVLGDGGVAGRVDLADINDWVVLNIDDPKARTPSGRISYGATRKADPDADLGAFVMRTLNERSIDPSAPGDYYIMPRSVYNGIQKAIRDESFRFQQKTFRSGADRITRLWRTITLNVLPRTAINNTIGSTILAIQAGAGPRSFYYAWKAITGKPARLGGGQRSTLPVPLELRQRYYEQLTDPLAEARGAFAPIAHWMNAMRYVNGMSEDFGRLAVWYHRAYPEAMRSEQGIKFFRSARRIDDKGIEMLEAMARRDPNYATLMDEFVEQSFDFLGDLHKGGSFAATMRIFIPFWQWYAHMLKLTFVTMPLKYPKRALFIQMLGQIGRDYQERMGVTVPYGESFVPFMYDIVDLPGGEQQIVAGVNLGNWWPQATTSALGGFEGDQGLVEFGQGAVAPFWTNSALILGSLAAAAGEGGAALELDERKILTAAKDEYGLPIEEVGSKAFWSYVANHFFRMVPLSPTMMGLGGRASNAMPLPGLMEPRAYSSDQIPEEYKQSQRGDVASVIEEVSSDPAKILGPNWWQANVFNFILKSVLGTPMQYMPGYGSLTAQRILRDYQYQIEDANRTQETMLRVLMERHGYDMGEGKNR